ncbi:unnamed protein product [Nezara viridula]|uniref:Uncharacterized protein n=1 Tax=Nezara viridula TaxID=85310 RepID=A0A9P0HCY4_NEZVI|nr:unnamed protein product [Nezara viridula]
MGKSAEAITLIKLVGLWPPEPSFFTCSSLYLLLSSLLHSALYHI